MNPYKPKRGSPEKKIENAIRAKLAAQGWFTVKIHGNKFQSGLPDIYATHSTYGIRWIEVKTKTGTFTSAQRTTFPKLSANGTRIWVLKGATDNDIKLLFGPENWYWTLNLR